MKSNYKKLGNYIRQTDVRNTNNSLGEEDLYGVSVNKEFITTHANLVGVKFDNYKVVKNGQFTYIPDTSRRGDKIAVALNDFGKEIIVSNVYTTFEISKPGELNADYLMMLFRNPEFDRYARYNSWGSAREVFSWDELCRTEMNIPSIEEQEKIVRQYEIIENGMESYNKEINKLYSLMQIIYDKLPKTINCKLFELTRDKKGVKTGKSPTNTFPVKSDEFSVPVIGASGIMSYTNTGLLTERVISTGRVGTIGKVMLWEGDNWFTDNSIVIQTDKIATVFCSLSKYDFNKILGGSSNPKITQTDMNNIEFNIPDENNTNEFEAMMTVVIDRIFCLQRIVYKYENLKEQFISSIV